MKKTARFFSFLLSAVLLLLFCSSCSDGTGTVNKSETSYYPETNISSLSPGVTDIPTHEGEDNIYRSATWFKLMDISNSLTQLYETGEAGGEYSEIVENIFLPALGAYSEALGNFATLVYTIDYTKRSNIQIVDSAVGSVCAEYYDNIGTPQSNRGYLPERTRLLGIAASDYSATTELCEITKKAAAFFNKSAADINSYDLSAYTLSPEQVEEIKNDNQ